MAFDILNIVGVIVSVLAGIFLFDLAPKTKLLRRGLLLLSAGIFVGLGFHSIFEFLESVQIVRIEFLLSIMPVLVILGAVLILLGGVDMLRNVMQPIREIIKNLEKFIADEPEIEVSEKVIAKDNELGFLFSLIIEKAKKLSDSKKELEASNVLLEQTVQERTKELQEKVKELEKFYKLTVGRELQMKELKQRIIAVESKKE